MQRINNWFEDPSGQSDIGLGFGRYGRQEQWNSRPRVQILTPHSNKEELHKPKLCSQCSKPISYIPQNQKWICYTCQLTWQAGFDTPLSSTENSIKPLQSNDPYERESPIFISVKPDRRLQGEYNDPELQITGSYRKAHIKTTNLGAVTEKRIKEYFQDEVYTR